MIVLLHVAIFVVAFLLMLNEFLKGAKKAHIDILLGLAWVGLVIVAFSAFGWRAGGLALLLGFLYGAISRPVAARVAARILSLGGGPSGRHLGLPSGQLARISKELGRQVSPEQTMQELFSGSGQRQKAEEALLDYCEANPHIQAVMADFSVSRQTLSELYSRLLTAGAGQWAGGHYVAASALAYPDSLRYILSRSLPRAG